MFSYLTFPRQNGHVFQPAHPLLEALRHLLPNLILSVGLSILGSVVLTLVTYWLNVGLGIPMVPFLFILI